MFGSSPSLSAFPGHLPHLFPFSISLRISWDLLIQAVKTLRDIALHIPLGSCPSLFHFPQGGVTALVRTKPMRVRAKLWFIVRFKDEPDGLLKYFIRPGRNT